MGPGGPARLQRHRSDRPLGRRGQVGGDRNAHWERRSTGQRTAETGGRNQTDGNLLGGRREDSPLGAGCYRHELDEGRRPYDPGQGGGRVLGRTRGEGVARVARSQPGGRGGLGSRRTERRRRSGRTERFEKSKRQRGEYRGGGGPHKGERYAG